jgi:hypothetical protein
MDVDMDIAQSIHLIGNIFYSINNHNQGYTLIYEMSRRLEPYIIVGETLSLTTN